LPAQFARRFSLVAAFSFNEAVLVAKVAKTFGLFSSKNETLGEFRYGI
jgi:hypothetical protein